MNLQCWVWGVEIKEITVIYWFLFQNELTGKMQNSETGQRKEEKAKRNLTVIWEGAVERKEVRMNRSPECMPGSLTCLLDLGEWGEDRKHC